MNTAGHSCASTFPSLILALSLEVTLVFLEWLYFCKSVSLFAGNSRILCYFCYKVTEILNVIKPFFRLLSRLKNLS